MASFTESPASACARRKVSPRQYVADHEFVVATCEGQLASCLRLMRAEKGAWRGIYRRMVRDAIDDLRDARRVLAGARQHLAECQGRRMAA